MWWVKHLGGESWDSLRVHRFLVCVIFMEDYNQKKRRDGKDERRKDRRVRESVHKMWLRNKREGI